MRSIGSASSSIRSVGPQPAIAGGVKLFLRCAFALICFQPAAALAQEPPAVPSSATEPQGFVTEPGALTRAVLFADRQLGKGDLTNGIYVDRGNMIPGSGWLSADRKSVV